jgi:hypothetical protein
MEKMWYISTMEHFSAIKKNKIMSLIGKCMELEFIMLRKTNQTEKDKYLVFSHMLQNSALKNE